MKKFNFSVGVLIAAARLGWINCKNGITDFAQLRAIYTSLYIQSKQDAIIALSGMPDEFQRSAAHELLRSAMVKKAKTGFKMWRKLRRYCVNAFPGDINIQLKKMGREYLGGAIHSDWTATEKLLKAGSTFISDNTATLSANSNMPSTFMQDYDDVMLAFTDAKDAFYESEENAETLTIQVNETANSVYDDLIVMLQDGQAVYEDDEALREKYVMEYLLEIVTPTGPAGLKGTAEINGEPAVGIIVELENKNLSVIVDAEGAFNFGEKLASGKDKLIFKQGDQILFEEEVNIPPGTTVREHVELPSPNN
jgi:hypothetical protein